MLVERIYKTELVGVSHFIKGHPKCGERHGHNYTVEVRVQASKDFVDFAVIKDGVEKILAQYDHAFINEKFGVSTAEELASNIAKAIAIKLDSPVVVVLFETSKYGVKVVEYPVRWKPTELLL